MTRIQNVKGELVKGGGGWWKGVGEGVKSEALTAAPTSLPTWILDVSRCRRHLSMNAEAETEQMNKTA